MPSMFGTRSRSGGGVGEGPLEESWKQLSAATVKFSNDKILKATGFIREALQLYQRGDKAKQEDFSSLFNALATLKSDRLSLPYAQHMEAIGAVIPAFAMNILPPELPRKEHLSSCTDSAQYYLNRIIAAAKETDDATNANWASAMNALIAAFSQEMGGNAAAGSPLASLNSVAKPAAAPRPEPSPTSSSPLDQGATLEGSRWHLRKAVRRAEPMVVRPESINQALSMEDCEEIAVKVEGKINAVLASIVSPLVFVNHRGLDENTRVDLEVSDVVTSVELVRCRRIRLFLNGHVPLVVLDGCEAVQIYLSAPSRHVKIVTAQCAEINVLAPASLLNPTLEGREEGEEHVELAIPAQFFSHVDEHGKLITVSHEHANV